MKYIEISEKVQMQLNDYIELRIINQVHDFC